MNAPDPAAWAKASAAAGAKPVEFIYKPHPRIDYTITPHQFRLEIPVEALENLTPDAHTRMLALLNDWISRHKPIVVPAAQAEPA